MPIPSTLLKLAVSIAPFCPLSLVHLTLFCGITANFCARQCLKRQRRQSRLELLICNLQMEKHGAKAFVEGNYYSHVKKKTLGKRHPSTKECSLRGGAGNAAPPAAAPRVWASIGNGELVGTSCPVH